MVKEHDVEELARDILEAVQRASAIVRPEYRRRFGESCQRALDSLHFIIVERSDRAGGAGAADDTLPLQLSEGALELLAALRAYDGQSEFVVHVDEGTAREQS